MSGYREIDAAGPYGDASGYEVEAEAENVGNWLESHGVDDPALVAQIRNEYTSVAILLNLNIDPANQGHGEGAKLLDEWLSDVTADVVLLVADAREIQRPGFELVEFYRRRGFDHVRDTREGPLMLLSL